MLCSLERGAPHRLHKRLTRNSLTATNASFYRPELDVLRFVAFLLVFFYHSVTVASGIFDSFRIAGALGVCLFFLLSSYLITELLEREKSQSGDIHLRAFYIRRGLRIWPLYFIVLLADYLLQLHLKSGVFTASRLLAFLLAAGNWYVAYHGFTDTISTPLWSIPVEEQFYILWPSARKYLHRSGSIVFSIAMFAVAYLALAHLCHAGSSAVLMIWVNSFVQFQFFSTGALLALALQGRAPKLHPLVRSLFFIIGLAALGAAQHLFQVKETSDPVTFHLAAPGYLCVNLGCTLLFFSFLGETRLGKLRPLVYLGKISYGLYVFHWAMLRLSIYIVHRLTSGHQIARMTTNALEVAFAFILTVLLASISYRFFESPILRYKKRFEVIRTRSV
jgi:peptidoglycan/LPS O-acetylase OafA/YrhL